MQVGSSVHLPLAISGSRYVILCYMVLAEKDDKKDINLFISITYDLYTQSNYLLIPVKMKNDIPNQLPSLRRTSNESFKFIK